MQMPNAEMSAWLGISYGSATNAPSARITAIASVMTFNWSAVRLVRYGTCGTAIRAPLERMLVEELCVVGEAIPFLEARRRCAVGGIEAGDDAEQRGRIRHGARQRTCGVLVGGDR